MKILIRLVVAVLIIMVVLAVVLAAPVLRDPSVRQFGPELDRHAAMIQRVPPGAEVLVIPAAGPTLRRLMAHEVTSSAFNKTSLFRQQRWLPWLVGGGDVVLWRYDSDSGAIANVDGTRRFLAPLFGATIRDGLLILGPETRGGYPLPSARPDLSGHLFALRSGSITAATIDDVIRVRSIAPIPANRLPTLPHNPVEFPESAMAAAAFGAAPSLVKRIEETLPVEISPLLQDGGMVALYALRDDRLLPRPRGVIVLPIGAGGFDPIRGQLEKLSPPLPFGIASESRRTNAGQEITRRESIGYTLEYTRRGDEVIVAFDKTSIERYLADGVRRVSSDAGSAEWIVRLDPRQLVPALDEVVDHAGLIFLLPDLAKASEGVLDSLRWIEGASEVIAVQRVAGQNSELDVIVNPPK